MRLRQPTVPGQSPSPVTVSDRQPTGIAAEIPRDGGSNSSRAETHWFSFVDFDLRRPVVSRRPDQRSAWRVGSKR